MQALRRAVCAAADTTEVDSDVEVLQGLPDAEFVGWVRASHAAEFAGPAYEDPGADGAGVSAGVGKMKMKAALWTTAFPV